MKEPTARASAFRTLFNLAGLLTLVAWGAHVGAQPPEPLPATAPQTDFSAERAVAALTRVLGAEPRPHPLGSQEHAHVRERLIAELEASGYAPELQRGIGLESEGPYASAAPVQNVLVRSPGSEPGRAILLAAHYDSTRESPGVGDDGGGVAALLEVARALRALPPMRHAVHLLFTDGEELGLLGAEAYLRGLARPEEIAAVLNFEFRGSSGPSRMFETGANNAFWVEAFDEAVSRPLSSSLYVEVYRRMPNGSDLTRFLDAGRPGYNFAAIGGWEHYHAPSDNFASLSAASVQHHGQQALELTRHLANAELPQEGAPDDPRGDAVYTDLFGREIVRWPASWSVPLALAGLVATAWIGRRRRAVPAVATPDAEDSESAPSPDSRSEPALAALFLLLLPTGAVYGLQALFARLTNGRAPSEFDPLQLRLALLTTAIFVACWTARRIGVRHGFRATWRSVWLLLSVLGVVLGATLPGASYVVLLPLLSAVFVAWITGAFRPGALPEARHLALVLTTGAAACLWLPLRSSLESALGLGAGIAQATVLALLCAAAAPLWADLGRLAARALLGLLGLAAVLTAVNVLLAPAAGVAPINVVLRHDAASGERELRLAVLGTLPASLASAAAFELEDAGSPPRAASLWTVQLPSADPASEPAPKAASAVRLEPEPDLATDPAPGEAAEDAGDAPAADPPEALDDFGLDTADGGAPGVEPAEGDTPALETSEAAPRRVESYTVRAPAGARMLALELGPGRRFIAFTAGGETRELDAAKRLLLTGFGSEPIRIDVDVARDLPEDADALLVRSRFDAPAEAMLPWLELRDEVTHPVHAGDYFEVVTRVPALSTAR